MAFDAYIQIDGIPGESTDDKHKDWIQITSVNWGMVQPASATNSSAGGSTAERVNVDPIQFTHLFDKASPKLYDASCQGTHIKQAIIHLCRAGGAKVVFAEVTLTQVLVSNVKFSGAAAADFPSEIISLSAGKYVWKYNQQSATGTVAGSVSAGWDLTLNKATA